MNDEEFKQFEKVKQSVLTANLETAPKAAQGLVEFVGEVGPTVTLPKDSLDLLQALVRYPNEHTLSALRAVFNPETVLFYSAEPGSSAERVAKKHKILIDPSVPTMKEVLNALVDNPSFANFQALRVLFENNAAFSLVRADVDDLVNRIANTPDVDFAESRNEALYALFERGAGFTQGAGQLIPGVKPLMGGCYFENGQDGELAAIVFDGRVFAGDDPAEEVKLYLENDAISPSLKEELAASQEIDEPSACLEYLKSPNVPSSFIYERGMMMEDMRSIMPGSPLQTAPVNDRLESISRSMRSI